jgi:flagellar basal body-associated protein FliL
MAKKVTLDTLDIEEAAVSAADEPVLVTEVAEKRPVKWHTAMWFRLLCAATVLFAGIGVSAYWWISSSKTDTPAGVAKRTIATTLPDQGNFERVNDFLVPLRTVKGQQKAAAFDLAFELNAGVQGSFNQNRVRIRSTIYQTVRQKTNDTMLGPGSMNALKDEIVAELEKYLGKDSIRKIYFTKYMVL